MDNRVLKKTSSSSPRLCAGSTQFWLVICTMCFFFLFFLYFHSTQINAYIVCSRHFRFSFQWVKPIAVRWLFAGYYWTSHTLINNKYLNSWYAFMGEVLKLWSYVLSVAYNIFHVFIFFHSVFFSPYSDRKLNTIFLYIQKKAGVFAFTQCCPFFIRFDDETKFMLAFRIFDLSDAA